MTSIAILGGTGYSGTNIAREAASRGIQVTAVARHAPADPLPDVTYLEGSAADEELIERLVTANDVLVVAMHAVDAAGAPVLPPLLWRIARAAAGRARLAVVGGAGSSLVAEGGPRLVDTESFPAAFRPEASTHAAILDRLRSDEVPADLEWFYASPAVEYGAYAPGQTTGAYRTGDDVLVTKADGSSEISGTDFALAFVDEIERPRHHNARFTTGH